MDFVDAMITTISVFAIVLLVLYLMSYFLGPKAHAFLRSNREEKIGLSKDKLFNANGYLVHSGSEILLGSTGSFKRFESVDREPPQQPQFGQATIPTPPPWQVDEKIPPQPLRPAPSPTSKTRPNSVRHQHVMKQQSLEPKSLSSAPASTTIKSVPRPVPRKQLSAPANCSIPSINPPDKIQKFVKEIKASTNPFLNGLLKLDSIKNTLFSTTIIEPEFKVVDERRSQSAFTANNPFTETQLDENVFDFNPKTIKSILEEGNDDGYEGDVEGHEGDPLKQLEARISKLEASGNQKQSLKNEEVPETNTKLNHINQLYSSQSSHTSIDRKEDRANANKVDKFVDTSITDALDNIAKGFSSVRNRSFSENEANEFRYFSDQDTPNDYMDLDQSSPLSVVSMQINSPVTPNANSTNPFSQKRLHKTASETYLEQYSMMKLNKTNSTSSSVAVNNKNNLSRHLSFNKSLGSQSSIDSTTETQNIKRAMSCESVSSQSSVVISDLEQYVPPVTGNLCVGLQYDKNSTTEDGCELLVTVLEARDLITPDAERVDTFVRIYLLPDKTEASQTKLFKNSSHPSYQETFGFWITKKNVKRSLWFHLYHTSAKAHTLVGETEMKLTDYRKPITTWLQLSDSRNNSFNWGELMFSLSYLPTAERLTVVVVKARNLKASTNEDNVQKAADQNYDIQNVFVKVYLLRNDKKVSKKKTTTKRGERSPVYNEAMIFSVPPYMLNSIQVRLTVVNMTATATSVADSLGNCSKEIKMKPIGHVIVGSGTDGKGLLHFHQMLTTIRKPIAMFHPLRRTCNKTDCLK